MSSKVDSKKCLGCGACLSVCPAQAIVVKNGKAKIEVKKCNKCQACVSICPVQAISNLCSKKK